MIDQRGDLKITDFGLARLCGENESVKQIGGTPGYMAPEHERGEEVTVRSDLYALGLILFEMEPFKNAKERWKDDQWFS